MAEDNGQNGAIDLSGLGSFDFAPSWTAGDKVVAKTGRGGGFRDQEEERMVVADLEEAASVEVAPVDLAEASADRDTADFFRLEVYITDRFSAVADVLALSCCRSSSSCW